ncbi:MAG: hypothetical protein IV090_02120 [Candidatus Sericytochromatia bacterium]|nr:hypothetical protein [Candidatus Sericytochromatia bacterium]
MRSSIWPRISSVFLASSLILSACGTGSEELPSAPLTQSAALTPANNAQTEQILASLPKIMAGIDDIKARIVALEVQPVAATTQPSAPTVTPAASGTKPTTTPPRTPSKPTTSTAPAKAPAKPAAPSAAEKGQAELMKVLSTFTSAGAVQCTIEKIEKHLQNGSTVTNKLKLSTRQPNTVKIEVLQSSKSPPGTKILYTSGVGNKVKVRPQGALSFVVTDLDKTDERLISVNKFPLDDTDFFGATKRLSSGYKATLLGTATVAGSKVNILKVVPNGTHSLNAQIAYEHIGYDPQTYAIRMMEMYDKSGGKEPFFRIVLPSIEYLDSLPESTFKL